MADICEEFWKSLHLEDYEDNCEIIVETDLLKTLKVEYDLLKEHSGRWLHFVAVDYPELKESLSPQKLMELKEQADAMLRFRKAAEDLGEYAADLNDKLEAVSKLVADSVMPIHPERIKDILEAEG